MKLQNPAILTIIKSVFQILVARPGTRAEELTVMQGFLLGLAVAPTCLAYCVPVAVPYLLGEGRTVRSSALAMGQFLGGRLCGYLAFAVLAWLVHQMLHQGTTGRLDVVAGGAVDLVLAGLLTWYGLATRPAPCAAHRFVASCGNEGPIAVELPTGPHRQTEAAGGRHTPQKTAPRRSLLVLPVAMGFLTGLNLCPPFLAAFTGAAKTESLGESLAFFACFFLGTLVFFLPLPLLGALGRFSAIKSIGRLTALVMAAFYVYAGIKVLAVGTMA